MVTINAVLTGWKHNTVSKDDIALQDEAVLQDEVASQDNAASLMSYKCPPYNLTQYLFPSQTAVVLSCQTQQSHWSAVQTHSGNSASWA